MVDFAPFRGLRPVPSKTTEVACVPYDVVDRAEAVALAAGKPDCLLHVTRPEIDLGGSAGAHGEAAYAQARRAFDRLLREGVLVRDATPAYYVYAQQMGAHRQVGLVGLASAADYWADRIKKHEHTRPEKEDDRKRNIETLGAQLGPIFLTFRARADVAAILAAAQAAPPEVDFVAEDGVAHQLWPLRGPEAVGALRDAFADTPALYVADGHHRTAAAARIGREAAAGSAAQRILAVVFPHDQLRILPYNRVVHDWGSGDAASFLAALAERFELSPLEGPTPPGAPREISMFLGGRWTRLRWTGALDQADPVARLDVSLLQAQVLAPLLGIRDPRRSHRISFVGGVRGLEALQARVDAGAAVAFALYPTALEDLMSIADAGEVMPPKSTWFEPKLRTGLVMHHYSAE